MFGMDEVLGATVSDSLKALPSVIRLPSHLPTWLTPSEEETLSGFDIETYWQC